MRTFPSTLLLCLLPFLVKGEQQLVGVEALAEEGAVITTSTVIKQQQAQQQAQATLTPAVAEAEG